jgi:hypothetical protein
MKKVLFALIIGALALVSCSKDETSTTVAQQEISVSSLPAVIPVYIAENYPDADISFIVKLTNSDTVYAVTLNTSELLAFDEKGSHLGHGEPGLECDSIGGFEGDSTGGHHGGGHHGGGHHGGGHPGGGHPGGGHHGGGHPGGFPLDSIPAAIAEYVAANYAGYTVHHAWNDTLCQFGTVIEVMIDSTQSAHRKLVFDPEGLFLSSAERILYAELPEIVSASIATNYATYSVRNKSEVFTLADNSLQYKVFLFQGTTHLSVVLHGDGTVVCEQ